MTMKFNLIIRYQLAKDGSITQHETSACIEALSAVQAIARALDAIANNADGVIVNVQITCGLAL